MSYYLKNTSRLNVGKMYADTPDGKFHKDDGTWAYGGSGTPSDTVTEEIYYYQDADAGSSSTYSRGDHTHGTPIDPVPGHESTYNHSNYNTAFDHSQSPHLQFSGLAKITVGITEPGSPSVGDIWIDIN